MGQNVGEGGFRNVEDAVGRFGALVAVAAQPHVWGGLGRTTQAALRTPVSLRRLDRAEADIPDAENIPRPALVRVQAQAGDRALVFGG